MTDRARGDGSQDPRQWDLWWPYSDEEDGMPDQTEDLRGELGALDITDLPGRCREIWDDAVTLHTGAFVRAITPGDTLDGSANGVIAARAGRAMRGLGALRHRYGVAIVERELPRGEGLGLWALTVRHTVAREDAWLGPDAPVTETVDGLWLTPQLLHTLELAMPRLQGVHAVLLRPRAEWPEPHMPVAGLLVTVIAAPPCGRDTENLGDDVCLIQSAYPTPACLQGSGKPLPDRPLVVACATAPRGWP